MRRVVWMVGLAWLLAGGACGGGGDGDGGGGGVVTSISGPLEASLNTVFVVRGEGFGAAGSSAQVRLTATGSETPFDGLTSASTLVDVDVLSSTTAVGVTPFAGAAAFTAAVELLPAGGGVLAGPGVIAGFRQRVATLPGPDDDVLVGDANPNNLDGGVGNDTLRGGAGDDLLFGGTGRDSLDGEDGNDTLDGGSGQDAFFLEPVPGTWADTIVDFERGQDLLVFLGVSADTLSLGLVADVSDGGVGASVVLQWTGGGTLTFQGLGTGAIDDLAALVDSGVTLILLP